MNIRNENEDWIIEIGDKIVNKKSEISYNNLNDIEKIIYIFWIIDYSIKNSGDLYPASGIFPNFKKEALNCSNRLNLLKSKSYFSLKKKDMILFFDHYFDQICTELKVMYEI